MEDETYGAYIITILASFLCFSFSSLFGASSMWYLLVIVIALVAGYFANKEYPIPTMAGCLAVAVIFPMAYTYYFFGRSSYLNIEMLIPMLIAIVPGYLVQFLISKLLSVLKR